MGDLTASRIASPARSVNRIPDPSGAIALQLRTWRESGGGEAEGTRSAVKEPRGPGLSSVGRCDTGSCQLY